MTGAIISQYYWNTEQGQFSRYFISGSFFFIEPDMAVTTYCILADKRSNPNSVYAEDYFYFDSPTQHFDLKGQKSSEKQCIRLDRDWVTEFPDKNVTLIKFPFPVSRNCFKYNINSPKKRQEVVCEGYGDLDMIQVHNDLEFSFITLQESQISKFKLFRQMASIESIIDETAYTDILSLDNIEVLNTDMHYHPTMEGGPILDNTCSEVLGILSHEPDDPFRPQLFKGVKLYLG